MGGAAAAVLIKERRIVDAFTLAGATSPARAVVPEAILVGQSGVGWRRLRGHAVIREAAPDSGRYYADLEVWQSLRRMRRRLIAVILAAVLLLAIAGTVLSSHA